MTTNTIPNTSKTYHDQFKPTCIARAGNRLSSPRFYLHFRLDFHILLNLVA